MTASSRDARRVERPLTTPLTLVLVSLQFAVSAAALFISCRYLERIWGPRELIRFCIITIVFSNVIAFGLSWILWFVLGAEDMM